ncbi:transglutaminase domain-containing protein [Candidatus Roizmanbacteria bacterium]|nr:transglutaminase domain-containing protein [Candidatus Roizmanbacteria bacterium]
MSSQYSFRFHFSPTLHPILFSVPQTNQYQTITHLTIPADRELLAVGDNQVLSISHDTTVSFDYVAHAIKRSFSLEYTLFDYEKNHIDKNFYLKPNRFIDGFDSDIMTVLQQVLSGIHTNSLFEIIWNVYQHVLSVLTYGDPITGLYTVKQALTKPRTDCGGFSTLLLSLLQSKGIPARLVSGFFVNPKRFQKIQSKLLAPELSFEALAMHVWVEVLLPDGSWFPIDPATEWRRSHGFSKRKGGFGVTEADRLVVSYGCDHMFTFDERKIQVDLLQYPVAAMACKPGMTYF